MKKQKKNKKLQYRGDYSIALPTEPASGQRRDITTRTYHLRTDTLNVDARSIEAVIATEAQVTVFDWSRWEFIEEVLLTSGCRIPANGQVPMLDTHDRSTIKKQHGSTRNLHIEGTELVGTNTFSDSEDTRHPWTLVREGHLTDNSIGYRVINSVIIPAGEKAEVEGRKFTAPARQALRVVTEWEVKENSLCAIGADGDAKNRNDNRVINRKDFKMDFKKWLQDRGLNFDELSDTVRAALEKDFKAEQTRAAADDAAKKAEQERQAAEAKVKEAATAAIDTTQRTTDPVDPKKIADEAVAAERQRMNDIRALSADDVPAEIIERCISENKTIDQARAIVLEEIRKARPAVGQTGPAIISHGGGQINRELIESAMLLRAGFEDIVLAEKEGERLANEADTYRDMPLIDVFRYAIVLDGRQIPVGRDDIIRAAFSTSSLPVLLGNVANKSLQRGYAVVPATWRDWCNVGNLPDFKEKKSVRITSMGSFSEVGSGGEIKYGSIEEEAEGYNIATYAINVGITRQQIINDDLGALTKIPFTQGVLGAKVPGDLVYTALLANAAMDSDSVAIFHADHSNLNTSKALSAANLATCLTVFAKQTDKNGKPISVPVAVLLVPPDLKFTAMELIKSVTLLITGSTDSVRGSHNVLADENLKVVSETRMSNASYSGYSATTWYLMGAKNQVDTIEVGFLNGKQTPTLGMFVADPDRMGAISRAYIDCGCKAVDFRGMQKNTA